MHADDPLQCSEVRGRNGRKPCGVNMSCCATFLLEKDDIVHSSLNVFCLFP